MKSIDTIAAVGLLMVMASATLRAQSTKAPDTYSLTETNALYGPSLTVEIYRDGNMALLDSSQDSGSNSAIATHTRTLYDLRAGKSYTLDLVNTSSPCGVSTFSGDWGDPFTMSEGITGDLAKRNPKTLENETIAGMAAKVVEVPDPAGTSKYKVWLDTKYNVVLKMQSIPDTGSPQTLIEVTQLSFTKPAPSLFTMPESCAQAAATPTLPTPEERIAAETGGKASDYALATLPGASKDSCTVLFKVVETGKLQPIAMDFQVALDTQIDVEHMPSYSTGVGTDGHVTYSGGNIQEVTGQMKNGVLRIENVPPQFNVDLAFGASGQSSALIYRQCYGPETTLLFVVNNPKRLSDGGDWLWVKKP